MLTSIFRKSKPVNLIIVAISIVVSFAIGIYSQIDRDSFSLGESSIALLIVLFYTFITGFIIKKNDLTKQNSYGIMVFGLLVFAFTEVFSNIDLLICNLLVLFALRRLFSLHTKRSLSKKFFDASFWIGLSSLFYSWSILYLAVALFALFYYWQNEGKYIAVSLIGLVTVFVLLLVYNIIINDEFILISNFTFSLDFDFSGYNNPSSIIRLTIVASVCIWSLVFFLKNLSEKNKKTRPIRLLVILSAIVAIIISLLVPEKDGSEYIFIIFPFAIIIANYIEAVEEYWFKEVFTMLLVSIPIIRLLL